MNKEPVVVENRVEEDVTNASRTMQVDFPIDVVIEIVRKVIKKGFFYEYVSCDTIVKVIHFTYSKRYSVFVILGSINKLQTNITIDVVNCKFSWTKEDEKHKIITDLTEKISKELRKHKV